MAQFKITNGPGKWDAMLNFFEENRHRMVTFFTDHNGIEMRRNTRIISIEKNGCDAWIIKGLTTDHIPFIAAYSFRTRKGTFQFTGDQIDRRQ